MKVIREKTIEYKMIDEHHQIQTGLICIECDCHKQFSTMYTGTFDTITFEYKLNVEAKYCPYCRKQIDIKELTIS